MKNKLIKGDAIEILSTLENKSIDLVLTDPPYDFPEELRNNLHRQFQRICRGAIIVFCPPENQWQPTCDQYLFWIKPISTKNTSKSYSRFVEMIQVWNGTIWNNDRHWSQYTNIFTDLVENAKIHPYAKPVSLITRLVLNHSNQGDLVFDPFMGIGTVGIVAMLKDRNFVGIERDETYFNVAEKRINENT